MVKNNIACRIFSEQLNLINQLPEKERANVLYAVINTVFSDFEKQNADQFDDQIDRQFDDQIDNQIGGQFDKQNANTYISISTSISKSISKMSVLSKTVYELLCKNIVVKEYSNNYGGVRDSRKKVKVEKEKPEPKIESKTETVAKKSYGEASTVKLTDEEYQKLKDSYKDEKLLNIGIDILDRYLSCSGKKYKSHYAVMRVGGWVHKEARLQKPKEILV